MISLFILVSVWLAYCAFTAFRNYQTRIPGPWYTNLSSIPLKYQEYSRNRRLWIHSLHQKYGPVVRLGPNEVSFNNLQGIKEIYQSGGSGFDKTEFYDLFKQYDHRTMFSTLNRQDHAKRKKLFAERYAMTNILNSQIVDGIRERAASVIQKCYASQARSYLDVYVTLHCYALDCASHFLMSPGGTRTLVDPDHFKLMQELSYHDSLRQRLTDYYSPFLGKLCVFLAPKSTSLSKDYILDRVRDDINRPSEAALLSKLQSKSSDLTDIETAAECMDHMAAGIDTTGDALCFLMHEISRPRSQHVQKRLQEELTGLGDGRLNELPYLDAVIKEGLRLFPPIPMSFPRYVPSGGHNISGYHVPGGCIVSCQPYSVHLLNEDVFPNPEVFAPERWMESQGKVDRDRLFFAFASGGRGCIGRNLAIVEMKTLLHAIYTRFRTEVSPEMKGDMSIDDQIIASRPKDQTCLLVFKELHA